MIDHFAQLDEDLQIAVWHAEQKVLFEQTHAKVRCGENDVNAYPVRRSGGDVVWNVTPRGSNNAIAYGVVTSRRTDDFLSLNETTQIAVQSVIEQARAAKKRVSAAWGNGDIYAYPHPSGGIAWGQNGQGGNVARGIR